MLRRAYQKVSVPLRGKRHRIFVDVMVVAVASYFSLQKVVGLSLTSTLAAVFMPSSAKVMTAVLLIVVVYTAVMKILLLILDAFPATRVKIGLARGLPHCCLRINNEIAKHIGAVNIDPEKARNTFLEHHNFEVNVALVLECLHEHLAATLEGLRGRDIFVSVYVVPKFEDFSAPRTSLVYLSHQPTNRDGIVSQTIVFADPAHTDYECVKCSKSQEVVHFLLDGSNYFKSKSKRHKKPIKHYIGMKLLAENTLLGFLNIEIYSSVAFFSEDELVEYIEEQLLPFKYLLEYQFLKRAFFSVLKANNLLAGSKNHVVAKR